MRAIRITRARLIALAEAQGFTVRRSEHHTDVRKGRRAIRIYADRTILRGDIDLALTKRMTVAEAVKYLAINT